MHKVHTYINAPTLAHTLTHTHAQTRTDTHKHTQHTHTTDTQHTQTNTHTYIHTHIYTHTHTHTISTDIHMLLMQFLQEFKTKQQMRNHETEKHQKEDQYICPSCQKNFGTLRALAHHCKTYHNGVKRLVMYHYQCWKCSQVSEVGNNLISRLIHS